MLDFFGVFIGNFFVVDDARLRNEYALYAIYMRFVLFEFVSMQAFHACEAILYTSLIECVQCLYLRVFGGYHYFSTKLKVDFFFFAKLNQLVVAIYTVFGF